MANHLGSTQSALPNPFQDSTVAPGVNPSTKNSPTSYFHGYRSNFDINQQKQQYQQRLNQQNNQRTQFNRNGPQRNHKVDRNATAQPPNNGSTLSNWCELCERGFKQPYQLEKHLGEHEKCWFDNCNFEGHSTLLQKHIETQHQSSLFQRINKIETDEDIEKWREERRKRYPTKANIEARRQAQEERLKRGERIDEPKHRFGNTKTRDRAQHRDFSHDNSNKSQNGKRKNDKKRRRTRNKNKNENENENENEGNVEAGKVVATKTTNDESKTADADVQKSLTAVANGTSEPKEGKVPSSSALAFLGMYGSDSDSECDNDEPPKIEDNCLVNCTTTSEHDKGVDNNETSEPNNSSKDLNEVSIESTNLKRPSSFTDELPAKMSKVEIDVNENVEQQPEAESDDDAPDEQPIQRKSGDLEQNEKEDSGPTQTIPEGKKKSKPLSNERLPKRRTVLDMTRKIRNQNTLLEKLLQQDIRHERNVLLQCVRYVVENNFFGVGQATNDQDNQEQPEKLLE